MCKPLDTLDNMSILLINNSVRRYLTCSGVHYLNTFYLMPNETDLAWSSSLEYVRIMVRHEACPQEEV